MQPPATAVSLLSCSWNSPLDKQKMVLQSWIKLGWFKLGLNTLKLSVHSAELTVSTLAWLGAGTSGRPFLKTLAAPDSSQAGSSTLPLIAVSWPRAWSVRCHWSMLWHHSLKRSQIKCKGIPNFTRHIQRVQRTPTAILCSLEDGQGLATIQAAGQAWPKTQTGWLRYIWPGTLGDTFVYVFLEHVTVWQPNSHERGQEQVWLSTMFSMYYYLRSPRRNRLQKPTQ